MIVITFGEYSFGGSGGDRTRGLIIANDTLSQTELPTQLIMSFPNAFIGNLNI